MMYSETGSPNNNISGGYVRAAIRPMGNGNADLYSELIQGLDIKNDKANGGDAGLSMAEAYRYFSAGEPYAGNNKAKTDYKGNTFDTKACCGKSIPVWTLSGNALDSLGSNKYLTPFSEEGCGKNYIIFISNGPAQDSASGGKISNDMLRLAGGDTATAEIGLSPSGSQSTTADEWARFMKHKAAEAVTTFTVDVLPGTTGQGPGWSRLLQSMAEQSGGVAYRVDNSGEVAAGLVGAINDALDRILAVNSVFASVALPAAANAQSTFLNQVFIGQFRPDPDALPRWPGNLKQYKLGVVGSSLKLQDADGDSVVDPGTGFIEKCANSFWSKADDYWSVANGRSLGLDDTQVCKEGGSDSSASNAPDGPNVEKGGQSQQLRAILPSARTVYTCDSTSPFAKCAISGLTSFHTSNNTALNAAGLADDLINWARGQDTEGEDGTIDTSMRASVHGDVIHSRPVAINYGDNAAPKIVVFYSGNDGMLRAINGNRPDLNNVAVGGVSPGGEIWSFMPPEFYAYIDVLRKNVEELKFPASSSPAGAGMIAKPYGIDGPITAFDGVVPDATVDATFGKKRKYLFAGMRRAGRAVYAFDVTDITKPEILWKKGCVPDLNSADCTSDWEDIGQTWAQANVIYSAGYVDATGEMKPMLIMGGGYDACEDYDNNTDKNHGCGGNPKGSLVYLLDAHTGAVLQTFDTDRGVVGAVTVVTYTEKNKAAQYAYATDLGGNVYRISGWTAGDTPAEIGNADPTVSGDGGWAITKIAQLGCDTHDAGCDLNRKFLFGPDVVRNPNNASQFTIVVGSGDREKPLENYGAAANVDNYFFSILDYPANPDWLSDDDDAIKDECDDPVICLDALTQVTTAGDTTVGTWGFALPLAAGEQVVTGAITVADTAYFSTHIPAKSDNVCSANLGTATAYSVDYRKAKGDETNIIGGGLVPTPVAGMVILDNGKKVPFCIGCGGEDSAIGAKLVGSGIKWKQPKSRVYWKIQQ